MTTTLLRPVLQTATGTPRQIMLAVLTRAAEVGVSPRAAGRFVWKTSRDPYVRDLAGQPRAVADLARLVAERALPDRETLARRAVAVLVKPVPRGGSAALRARTAAAVVAAKIVLGSRGWDTALITSPQLAASLNVSRPTATARLRLADEQGLIRIKQQRSVGGFVVGLRGMRRTDDALSELIADLSQPGEPHTAAAWCLLNADHPATTYGDTPAGFTLWFATVCLSLPEELLQWPKAHLSACARFMLESGLTGFETASDVAAVLDAHAAATGADLDAIAAEMNRVADAETRKADVEKARARAALLRPILAAIMADLPARGEPMEGWLSAAQKAVSMSGLPAAAMPHLRVKLRKLLLSASRSEAGATRIVDTVVPVAETMPTLDWS